MEILRFDEPDAPTPKRKRPSKAWLALSMVAALMGVGTAFASSTIQLNNVQLGQGVTSVVACDNSIGVVPKTGFVFDSETAAAHFALKTLAIGSSETNLGGSGTVSENCSDKIFKITLYHDDKSVGVDGNPSSSLCTYFIPEFPTSNSVKPAQKSECRTDSTGPYDVSSIYFQAATSGDQTYVIDFYDYNLSNGALYLDPSNITVETVSNYPN
jgi:hypothetical protein